MRVSRAPGTVTFVIFSHESSLILHSWVQNRWDTFNYRSVLISSVAIPRFRIAWTSGEVIFNVIRVNTLRDSFEWFSSVSIHGVFRWCVLAETSAAGSRQISSAAKRSYALYAVQPQLKLRTRRRTRRGEEKDSEGETALTSSKKRWVDEIKFKSFYGRYSWRVIIL